MRNGAALLPCSAQLPIKTEATNLPQYFLDNVQYLYPVLKSQSVEHMIDAVYMNQNSHVQSKPADIALLLSILASASHLWRPQRSKDLIFLSAKEAASLSSMWSNATLDVLEYSRRTTAASVEDLQATIVISYVIYNSQGFSPMFRSLHSNMITMARDLSLHKIDSPQGKGETDPQPSQIEADVKTTLREDYGGIFPPQTGKYGHFEQLSGNTKARKVTCIHPWPTGRDLFYPATAHACKLSAGP